MRGGYPATAVRASRVRATRVVRFTDARALANLIVPAETIPHSGLELAADAFRTCDRAGRNMVLRPSNNKAPQAPTGH